MFTFQSLFTHPFRAPALEKVNTRKKYGSTKAQTVSINLEGLYQSAGDLGDVRAYGYKAERAAALIYAHFKKEFMDPFKSVGRNN